MQSFVDKIKSFFNVRTKGMRLVLFNVMVVVAVLGGVFSIIMAIASLLPVQPVPIFIVAILIAALPFYLAKQSGPTVRLYPPSRHLHSIRLRLKSRKTDRIEGVALHSPAPKDRRQRAGSSI